MLNQALATQKELPKIIGPLWTTRRRWPLHGGYVALLQRHIYKEN